VRNTSLPTGFDTRTVQPVASSYEAKTVFISFMITFETENALKQAMGLRDISNVNISTDKHTTR
jgi:hypothetical protein